MESGYMKNMYEVRGEVTAVFVSYKNESFECLIDSADFEKVNSIKGKWFASKHHNGKYYIRGPYKSKKVLIHRFILEPNSKMVVDHINLEPLDNRRSNMRIISNAENKQNLSGARSDSTNGVRGVLHCKRSNIWLARITVNGEYKGLGSYHTKEEAAEAVIKGRKEYMPFSQEALTN